MKKLKRTGIVTLLLSVVLMMFAFKTDYFEVAKQIEIYTSLFKELNLYYIDDINPASLTENAIDNMLNDLDPYTKYYDEQGVEDVKILSNGEYSGIGATTKLMDNKLVIVELYKDMPAEKAGIIVGDEIVKINDVIVKENNNKEILSLLKGTEETSVNLQILRQQKTLNFQLQRNKIEIDPVPHYQMIDSKIGYISFIKFNGKASASVKKAFLDLKSQGMEKLIFDLRGNLGGLLNEAIEITNFFIPKNEVVVTTKAKLKKWSEAYKTKNEPIDLNIPIVVLIDNRSASASEIVAGSLQDFDRAVILGERSFGKGLVQRYRDLPYGSKLKLTISKYYTPSGRNIQEMDYSHRTKNNIPKFSDNPPTAFKTKNGRTVYDGGGIEPDVSIDKPERTNATEALYNSNTIFNFVTNYYYDHPNIAKPKDFKFDESEYQNFISYLKNNPSLFKTKTEKIFEAGINSAEEEKYKKQIEPQYNDLIKLLEQEKIQELSLNKVDISEHINDEILNRYYFKKGEYINHIYNSKFITEAIKVLNDEQQYKNILQ
ncbi:MAG: S41 family peptidase [Bacteroidota bacterium]